jgi:hypothetical protein
MCLKYRVLHVFATKEDEFDIIWMCDNYVFYMSDMVEEVRVCFIWVTSWIFFCLM